ncbi:DUF2510 domain-containing protein [Modestobacter sp. VKM Ac-2986]|uniref:DUF2510 domain-containing protein n=1 Tax=Modestobacter sp. VKM Ac-2986 TaxID=3004140 RepID=UPI0022ABB0B0|nr:DUF2510 domain-containing protein [Modestobacter sp. VKM Ac-2986]MCZ2829661.1 DUF2510 domain-containing protein [Modestobacter sp. VKM Ac-2986]
MTGPGQPSPPPGWYPDPDGGAGLVRWWSGSDWSDVTTPAGPGVTVGRSFDPAVPAATGPAQTWDSWGTPEPTRPRRTPSTGLLVTLGGLGLALVLLLVAVLLGTSSGSEDDDRAPQAAPSSPTSTFPPGTVRIFDREAGISYPYLGNGWFEWDRGDVAETTATAGQYFVTQDDVPPAVPGGESEDFIAQCTSGPLAAGFGWGGGTGTLQGTGQAVADRVRASYYPRPNERQVLRSEARTVDGADAWLYEFDLRWDDPDYDASGERAALLVIDVGRPSPALLYLSIPNTHAELYGTIDRVLDDVDVL